MNQLPDELRQIIEDYCYDWSTFQLDDPVGWGDSGTDKKGTDIPEGISITRHFFTPTFLQPAPKVDELSFVQTVHNEKENEDKVEERETSEAKEQDCC